MAKPRGSKRLLKADPTDWLLEEDNPVVRWWALRDLVRAPARQVEAARRRALQSEVVREVFRQQRPGGHWERRDNMHAPHYTSTIYQLSLLGDLGPTAADRRVAAGVEAVLRTQRTDGGFPGHDPHKCEYGPYDIGLIIRFMRQFGLAGDRRLARMCRWVERHQMAGGGWTGVHGHDRPAPGGCLNATANVLWGLAAGRKLTRTPLARRGVEFLARATAADPGRTRWLSYPQFWNFWVDDIKLAEIYLRLGVRPDRQPLAGRLHSILDLQGDDGRWAERRGPYTDNRPNCRRMRRLFPRKGRPSKWVTAKAMTVLKLALSRSD
ncbi:MAG: hypothetical protein AMJ81_08300 [Phycisphaerae bacterium SM23_33]|nr:MAG: hypothetical protein AMJ81_08300 [Phycisphaerae bacterium SM23_33]